jgi:hypothetical protein
MMTFDPLERPLPRGNESQRLLEDVFRRIGALEDEQARQRIRRRFGPLPIDTLIPNHD